MALTKDDVFRCCDALFERGVQPTVKRVMESLNTKSKPRVVEWVAEWKRLPPKANGRFSSELSEAIALELNRYAESARTEAEEYRRALEEDLLETSKSCETFERLAEQRERQIREMELDVSRLQGVIDHRSTEVDQLREAIERERDAAESARVETATALAELRAVEADRVLIPELRRSLETERQSLREAKSKIALLEQALEAEKERSRLLLERERAAATELRIYRSKRVQLQPRASDFARSRKPAKR